MGIGSRDAGLRCRTARKIKPRFPNRTDDRSGHADRFGPAGPNRPCDKPTATTERSCFQSTSALSPHRRSALPKHPCCWNGSCQSQHHCCRSSADCGFRSWNLASERPSMSLSASTSSSTTTSVRRQRLSSRRGPLQLQARFLSWSILQNIGGRLSRRLSASSVGRSHRTICWPPSLNRQPQQDTWRPDPAKQCF